LKPLLPRGASLTDPDGGFVAWLELPEAGQGDRLAELAALRGVRVVPGRAFDAEGRPSRGVRLSLSRASVPEIEAGARVLAELTNELVRGPALLAVRNYL
jgi:2-aminoadipate transaminase